MFGTDVKTYYSEKIYSILVILYIVHIGTRVISFLFKWVYPYVKSYALMQRKKEVFESNKTFGNISQKLANCQYGTGKEAKVKVMMFDNSDSSEEEYKNLVRGFQSLHSASSEIYKNTLKEGNILNRQSLEVDRSVSSKKFKMNYKERKSSSEAQTNIPVHPIMKVDHSCPKLILSHTSSRALISKTESVDSFHSASSNSLRIEDGKCLPKLNSFKCRNLVDHREKVGLTHNFDEDFNKSDNLVQSIKGLQTHEETPSLTSSRKHICNKDNKILKMAIIEFQKELKPIRDQIGVLKDYLYSFDSYSTCSQNLPSDMNPSINETVTLSECCSGPVLSTCDTDIMSCYFMSPTKETKKCGSLGDKIVGKLRLNDKETFCLSKIERPAECKHKFGYKNLQSTKKPINPIGHSEVPKLNKRSPLAEMYVTLSQCSLQSTSFIKHTKMKSLNKGESKNIKCQINLSFNVEALSSPNEQKGIWLTECKIQPLLSEPEDILGEPSGTHVSLKPAQST